MGSHLHDPTSRDSHYGKPLNVAQYLVDIHDANSVFDFCGGTIPWRELGLLPCLDGFFVVSDSGCTHGLGLGDSMVWFSETKISIFLDFKITDSRICISSVN